MLFDDAVAEYMADKSRRLRATTMAGYESAVRCHLMPRWAGRELESIGLAELQEWVDGFALPGAAGKAYKTFRQVFRWACRRHGLRVWDVTQGVELPRVPDRPRRALTAAKERETLRGVAGQEWEAVVLLAAALGLRRCEACGMRWEDVDWRTGEVRVRRSRQVVGGREVVEEPKTGRSARSCWLPRFAARRLRQIRAGRRGWLCALSPDAVARRIRSACRAAGAPWTSMTECRHTWATLAVEAGVGIETVAMMLGHTDISTAYEHYIVSRPRICRDAQREVERLILTAE